jgi:predicted nucleic acid-binding protein
MINEKVQTEVNRLSTVNSFRISLDNGGRSVIALVSGFQAKKLIRTSENVLTGKKKANQSILIGILGLLVWVVIIIFILKYRRN